MEQEIVEALGKAANGMSSSVGSLAWLAAVVATGAVYSFRRDLKKLADLPNRDEIFHAISSSTLGSVKQSEALLREMKGLRLDLGVRIEKSEKVAADADEKLSVLDGRVIAIEERHKTLDRLSGPHGRPHNGLS